MTYTVLQPRTSAVFDPVRSVFSHPVERGPLRRGRANISNACQLCRRRKRRCPGGQPCPSCAASNTECHYEVAQDRRRKLYNDRAKAHVEFQQSLLEGLLQALRSEHCDIILRMIQQNASMEDLADELDRASEMGRLDGSRLSATTDDDGPSEPTPPAKVPIPR